jgi:hypothetical protein
VITCFDPVLIWGMGLTSLNIEMLDPPRNATEETNICCDGPCAILRHIMIDVKIGASSLRFKNDACIYCKCGSASSGGFFSLDLTLEAPEFLYERRNKKTG